MTRKPYPDACSSFVRRGFAVGALALAATPTVAQTLFVPEEFPTIQAALEVASDGVVVSVAPGTYQGPVAVQSDGVTLLSRELHAATIDGNGEHAVICNNVICTIEGFTITNAGSNRAGVFTSKKSQVIRNNRIVGNNGDGIKLSGDSVALVESNTITDGGESKRGIRVMTGASGVLLNNYIAGNGTGIQALGVPRLVIEHNTITDNTWNIVLGGTAVIRHNIIANASYGIYYTEEYALDLQGYVADHLTIAYNDVWNHSEFDYQAFLGGFPFANTGRFTPEPGTGQIAADPLLVGVELQSGSPCIDAGDDPATFAELPCRDIEGKPRLIDGDLDAVVRADIGAFEFAHPPPASDEVRSLRWADPTLLAWDVGPDASFYSLYRGDLAEVGYNQWGACLATTDVASFAEVDVPDAHGGFFYLVTASDALALESLPGFATCALRSNADPCVVP